MVTSKSSSIPLKPTIFRGEAAILGQYETVSDLAAHCGQSEAVAYLPFFLSGSKYGAKVPELVHLRDVHGALQAAVLFYQYSFHGIPTGVYVPMDFCGDRNVISAEPVRSSMARRAAEVLMERGARLVLVSLLNGEFSPKVSEEARSLRKKTLTCATQTRTVIHTLKLASTLEETMASMGTRTRRNLRAFRRRVETELGGQYHAVAELSESEFLELNRSCLYPVADAYASFRYRSAREIEGSLFAGLRASDGRWLSLIGGRHLKGTTYVDWQLNSDSLPSYSLGTAMRAFLLESEVARGTEFLCFEGGTPHSIHRAFLPQAVSDLLLAHRWLTPERLRTLLPRVLPKGNSLAELLQADTLVWSRLGK